MATITAQPAFVITYNGRNVTADVTRYVLAITYTDRVSGKSDELEIQFTDTDGRWRTTWAPEKGDRLMVQIGIGGPLVNCGTFEVDEIEYEGMPEKLTLRALAAGTSKSVRTKNSSAHEGKTLRQIAQAIATRNGLTLQGDIEDITIARRTQHRETDLSFLRRLADEYGYIFSIRDAVMTFHSVYNLEEAEPVKTLLWTDLSRYSVRVKTVDTFKATKVSTRNPSKNEVVQVEYAGNAQDNADGIPFAQVTAEDTQVIHTRTEDQGQADRKAKAAHHKANSKEVTAEFEVPGDPLLVAGNNFAVHGLGIFSAIYHVLESRHQIGRDRYMTTLSAKKVNTVAADDQQRTENTSVPPAQIAQNG